MNNQGQQSPPRPAELASIPPDQLAVSSWCWASDYYRSAFSLLDLPGRAAAARFQQVEANDFMLPPPRLSRLARPMWRLIPHSGPEVWRYRLHSLRQLKQALDLHEVGCICWTMNTNFTVGRGGRIGQFFYHWWGLRAAVELATPLLRIIAGGGDGGQFSTAVVRRMAGFVAAALKQRPGTAVVFENHWGISSDIDTHLTLFQEVKNSLPPGLQSRFSLCLDPANLPPERPEAAWEKMAPLAGHVHLKSRVGERPLDIKRLLAVINQAHGGQYGGYFVVEDSRLFFP